MVRRYDEPIEVRVGGDGVGGDGVGGDGVGGDGVGGEVRPGADGTPQSFRWRGRHYAVSEVQAHWCERRAWWRDLGEVDEAGRPLESATERVLWRVAAGGGVFVIGSERGGGSTGGSTRTPSWLLLRAED